MTFHEARQLTDEEVLAKLVLHCGIVEAHGALGWPLAGLLLEKLRERYPDVTLKFSYYNWTAVELAGLSPREDDCMIWNADVHPCRVIADAFLLAFGEPSQTGTDGA
jgi:hypothetical protein